MPFSPENLGVSESGLPLLRELIHRHTGLFYENGRNELLCDRLAPLVLARGFRSYLDFYYLLKFDDQAGMAWRDVMDALSVQETYFWRESDHLKALATTIIPRLIERHRRSIRIWSIPCASGEEPLSIAMALNEAGAFHAANIEIHASDASAAALAKARSRRYGRRSFRQLPSDLQARYFTREPGKEEWIVDDDLFARINSWSRVNVVNPAEVSGLASCDVIFCRNLFIYFTPPCIREVARTFWRLMPSPAYLCVGAAESLLKAGVGFDLQEIGGAYVYVKA